jgi:hypothetical protein
MLTDDGRLFKVKDAIPLLENTREPSKHWLEHNDWIQFLRHADNIAKKRPKNLNFD